MGGGEWNERALRNVEATGQAETSLLCSPASWFCEQDLFTRVCKMLGTKYLQISPFTYKEKRIRTRIKYLFKRKLHSCACEC